MALICFPNSRANGILHRAVIFLTNLNKQMLSKNVWMFEVLFFCFFSLVVVTVFFSRVLISFMYYIMIYDFKWCYASLYLSSISIKAFLKRMHFNCELANCCMPRYIID